MQLLNSIIGGSMSSRLFQQIREERGLAYSVYSISQSYISDGIYSIYAGVSHEKVEETIKAIIDEMRLLANQGITNDELQTAKEQLKSSYVFSQENVNSRMFSIGKNSLLLSRLYTVEEIIDKINKVSMEDMLNAYECIADIKRYSVALISNRDYNLRNIIQES
jgi:predicted Zn-dependent peptidase